MLLSSINSVDYDKCCLRIVVSALPTTMCLQKIEKYLFFIYRTTSNDK